MRLASGTYKPLPALLINSTNMHLFDTDGDKIFENYEVDLKDSNDRTPGTVHITGGTGKYQGITGTLAVTVEVLQPLGPGHTM
jgi:hypothetical protein